MKNKLSQLLISPKFFVSIIILVVSILYFQTFFHELIFLDDNTLVYSKFEDFSVVEKIQAAFTSNYLSGQYYRPITLLSLIIESEIAGDSTFIYHFSNYLIHLLTSLLLFFILKNLGYKLINSFIAALLFSINPIHINAVGWIAGRGDLLAAFFSTLAFFIFLKFMSANKALLILPVSVLLLLAILSKEVSMLAPFIFLAFYFIEKRETVLNKNIVGVFLMILIVIGTYYFLRAILLTDVHLTKFSFSTYFRNFLVLPETISKFFIPTGIKALPGIDLFTSVSGTIIMIILLLFPLKFNHINKQRYYFGIIWFVLLMLPGMVFRTMEQDGFFYWDCRSYLPLIGLVLVTVEILNVIDISKDKKIFNRLILIYFLILGSSTISKCGYYENAKAYWSTVKSDYPNLYLPYIGLYNYYDHYRDFINAEHQLLQAIIIRPTEFSIRRVLINFYLKNNEKQKAFLIVKESLDIGLLSHDFFFEKLISLSVELNRLVEIDNLINNYSDDDKTYYKVKELIIREAKKLKNKSDTVKANELLEKISPPSQK